jgi:DNA-binding CsgD family transcriptional regulator
MAFVQTDSADASFLLQIIGDLYEDGPWDDVLLSLRDAMLADEVILTLVSQSDGSAQTIAVPESLSVSNRQFEKSCENSRFDGAARGWSLSVSLGSFGEVDYRLEILRGPDAPPFKFADERLLDEMVPHLARAARVRAALAAAELEQKLHAEPLDRLILGSLIVDGRLRLIGANTIARRALASVGGLVLRGGVLQAARTDDNCALVRAVDEVISGTCAPSGTALFVRRSGGEGNLGLVVKPLCMKNWVTGRLQNAAVILISGIEAAASDRCGLLRQLFNFTPAETMLAIDFINGLGIEEMEQQRQIKHNTTRAHLRSMYQKLGVSRYGDMMQILANHTAALERDFMSLVDTGVNKNKRNIYSN